MEQNPNNNYINITAEAPHPKCSVNGCIKDALHGTSCYTHFALFQIRNSTIASNKAWNDYIKRMEQEIDEAQGVQDKMRIANKMRFVEDRMYEVLNKELKEYEELQKQAEDFIEKKTRGTETEELQRKIADN